MNIQDKIYLIIAVGSAAFAIFFYFRRPQEQGEINDKVFDEKFSNLTNTVLEIKDNHLKHINDKLDRHIEKQIESEKLIASNFTKTFTLLDIIMKK